MKQKNFKEKKLAKKNKKEVEMAGRGIFGIRIRTQRNLKNIIGWTSLIIGIYLLLAFLNIVPFTPRFDFLDFLINSKNLLITSIVLIVLGVLINEKIRNIFRR